jgi:DNA invertase Pin-like site-specific DNA recombinase
MDRRGHCRGAQGEGHAEAGSEGKAKEEEDAMTIRMAIYARVSTTNHGQDVNMQLRELREYCERRGWQIAGEYTDVGISGSKDSRPELNRLMADAKQRRFDAVCVWKLDRFGRSLRHLVNALADLESLGVSFTSIKDNLDLSTPSGRLMFQIIGAMAEFERSLIQERVKAGLRNARAKGKTLGRPRKVVDAGRIAALRAEGFSWRAIASELGVGLATLHRASVPRSKTQEKELGTE